jgi:hypothetical protein
MRRRARFLRKARELAYRDLGGLVFDLHRFGQRNDPVVLAKLATLGQIDNELRAIEQALHEIRPVTVLREVGIGTCPRCAALHGSEDRFCPGCGMPFDAGAERPLSTTPVMPNTQHGASSAPAIAAAPSHAPASASLTSPTGQLASPAGSPASSTGSPAPSTGSPASTPRLAAEPLTTLTRPNDAAAPPLKPTAAPIAARPGLPAPAGAGQQDGGEKPEEEPTQILRPTSDGA